MPLSQQLKSDMTGIPAETTQKKEAEKPVIEPLNIPNFSSDMSPTPEVGATNQTKVPDTTPRQPDVLKSIENQLIILNQNILDLGQAVNDSKNIDFRAVFAKIDSARVSIEKLITPTATQPVTESDGDVQKVLALLQSVIEKQEKNDRQLTQTLRDNATFQIQVRQGMQRDLDSLKEQMNGEQFNPLLKEIASVYVEYQTLLDDESISDRSRKNLHALFEQLEDMLSDYDAEVCRSEVGSVRQTRTCKIIEKIPTGDQEKHNTIAASRKPGVVRGRSVLYPEFVDVFVFDPSLTVPEIHNDESVEETMPDLNPNTQDTAVEAADTPVDESDSKNNLGGNE